MVDKPTRGDAPPMIGPDVLQIPATVDSTVSADVYRDRMRYDLERERVLRASWMIGGRSSELADTNDWLLYEGHGETGHHQPPA